jgi:hypothetical protein
VKAYCCCPAMTSIYYSFYGYLFKKRGIVSTLIEDVEK